MVIVKQKLFTINGVLIFLLIINTSYTIIQSNTYNHEISNLNKIINEQNKEIIELNSKIMNINETISTRIEEKEILQPVISTQINSLSKPDFDSGWITIEPDSTIVLEHNMGYNILVYIIGWDYNENGVVLHQDFQGIRSVEANDRCGLSWYCDKGDCIRIHRMEQDKVWDEFRVYIWKIDY